jgi:hypothetical protein
MKIRIGKGTIFPKIPENHFSKFLKVSDFTGRIHDLIRKNLYSKNAIYNCENSCGHFVPFGHFRIPKSRLYDRDVDFCSIVNCFCKSMVGEGDFRVLTLVNDRRILQDRAVWEDRNEPAIDFNARGRRGA